MKKCVVDLVYALATIGGGGGSTTILIVFQIIFILLYIFEVINVVDPLYQVYQYVLSLNLLQEVALS